MHSLNKFSELWEFPVILDTPEREGADSCRPGQSEAATVHPLQCTESHIAVGWLIVALQFKCEQ